MSYRNQHLTPHDQEFKRIYKSVIDAHVQLTAHGEVVVEFTTHNNMLVWRRRCYEYQRITGKTFRIEMADGYRLHLRPRYRTPVLDFGIKSVEPVTPGEERPLVPPEELPDHTAPPVTEADLEMARRILAKIQKGEKEVDPIAVLKGGADGTGRSESGGDESDT